MNKTTRTEHLIQSGFFIDKDLNCAETVLVAANEVHELNLSNDALRLSAGFGGGVGGMEMLCGALNGGVMALSRLIETTLRLLGKKID